MAGVVKTAGKTAGVIVVTALIFVGGFIALILFLAFLTRFQH
jgi:hypothetical protein